MTDIVRSMTAEDYFDLPETDGIDELIEGEYVVSPPPLGKHQLVAGNVYYFIRSEAPSGQAVFAPAAIRFEADHVLEPDVFWIRSGGECQLQERGYWQGAPDLVVEVLSPSTAKRDRGIKFDVYERHGVREYWLVDPEAQFIEVYQRADEHFQRQGVYGVENAFASAVLGVEVKVAAIFAD